MALTFQKWLQLNTNHVTRLTRLYGAKILINSKKSTQTLNAYGTTDSSSWILQI